MNVNYQQLTVKSVIFKMLRLILTRNLLDHYALTLIIKDKAT